jgi:hypothetical protein
MLYHSYNFILFYFILMFHYLFASLTSLLTIQIRMCFEKQSSFPQYGQCTHICCLFRACSSMLITHSLHTTHPHSPSRGKFPLSIRTVVGCGVSWGRVISFSFPSNKSGSYQNSSMFPVCVSPVGSFFFSKLLHLV